MAPRAKPPTLNEIAAAGERLGVEERFPGLPNDIAADDLLSDIDGPRWPPDAGWLGEARVLAKRAGVSAPKDDIAAEWRETLGRIKAAARPAGGR